MIDKLRQAAGFSVGALVVTSCILMGKVVAVDIPHSPLGIVASMIQEAPVKLSDSSTNTLAGTSPVAVVSDDSSELVNAEAKTPVAKPNQLYHIVMDEQSTVSGQLRVASYAFNGVADEIVPADGTSVKLISHCTTAYEGVTDQSGHFSLNDVTPGVYTLLADGEQGVLVMRVSVEENTIFPASELNALLVPNVDAHYVRSVINERLPQETKLPEYLYFDHAELPDAPVPPPLATEVSTASPETHNYELSGKLLRLNPTSGEVIPVSETAAELIRNGRAVQPVSFETDGVCEVSTLEAEHYSFVAVGVDGICAVGLECGSCGVADYGAPVDAYAPGCCTEMAVVPYDDCAPIIEEEIIVEEPCYEEDWGAWGGGGGCCGGGGGGGGYGGWGSLLGLAGLAGLAGLIDDDDNNKHGGKGKTPFPPKKPPATPFKYSYH